MGALDHGSVLKINRQNQAVWASILAFLGNIKQQQASGRLFRACENFCCWFCDTGSVNCANLIRDTITYGWYHYQVCNIWEKSLQVNAKANKNRFLSKNRLKPNAPAFQIQTSGLDLIIGYLPDFAHSEFFGLVQKLYLLLNIKILTLQAAKKFVTVFHNFIFPFNWGWI